MTNRKHFPSQNETIIQMGMYYAHLRTKDPAQFNQFCAQWLTTQGVRIYRRAVYRFEDDTDVDKLRRSVATAVKA